MNKVEDIKYGLFQSRYENGNYKGLRAKGYNKPVDGHILTFDRFLTFSKGQSNVSFLTLLSIENKRFSNKEFEIRDNGKSFYIYKNGQILKEIVK